MYLETILVLSQRQRYVRSIDVAEYMGYSKPSVSRAIGILKNGGYVNMDKDGYLTLTDEACAGYSTATRVSPPLRSRDHVEAMRAGLKDGTIDAIVTDHAPHAPEEKDVEFRYAPNGFCGLETSVGVILTELYHTGEFSINEIVNKMSTSPARISHCSASSNSAERFPSLTCEKTNLLFYNIALSSFKNME